MPTVAELRKKAAVLKIKGRSNMKKSELLRAISQSNTSTVLPLIPAIIHVKKSRKAIRKKSRSRTRKKSRRKSRKKSRKIGRASCRERV